MLTVTYPYAVRQFNPWRELRQMSELLDRAFYGSIPARRLTQFPAINIKDSENGATLIAELPGVEPSDIEVTVQGSTLTIKGERKAPEPGSDKMLHRAERWHGKFERAIELPYSVDAEMVCAQSKNGVLTIGLPKAEAHKPRKITIAS